MKTLHFDASGAYTGYSINKSSILEVLVNGIITAASLAGSALTLYNVGKQASDAVKARKNSTTNDDDFEDPK